MSDSDGDFSDELLELAGATEKKRKRREGSSKSDAKRRKGDTLDVDGPESEDDVEENPYPLDGKFIDEYDRQRLLEMPEIEREELIAQRLEELQRITDKRNLDQMVKAQKDGDGDSVSKAAKRQHTVRGATKEKSRKLDELKAKRKAKDERKRSRGSPKRDRSSSPMEMETSDEEEDGQITKFEQEEEKERKLLAMTIFNDEPVTIDDLNKVRLTRDALAKHFLAPWFKDYVKGAYVRYLVGVDKYRIYEISQVRNHSKHYKINDKVTCNLALELRYGTSMEVVPMDRVSNVDFNEAEFGRFKITWETSRIKLPTKRELEKKAAQIAKLINQPMTENDITAMLQRKSQLQGDTSKPQTNRLTLERARLMQARTLALRRNDKTEVAMLDVQLAELAVESPPVQSQPTEDASVLLAKVNERNRKANQEAIRRAELQEADRKRRERRLGTGTPTVFDPSARLRTVPRMFASRSATPNPGESPSPDSSAKASRTTLEQSPSRAGAGKGDFHARVLDTIEIDLGDF
ncbi:plus-3-domain-containing protein [Russula earlei]|uniref:Plus-3-domain-containing protein n=1 Tax=Russula earlei TaxID=71964 RepID=A0ACC0U204_9AGAM|nr:plus-3-domain-containing protein [Russula earlei]